MDLRNVSFTLTKDNWQFHRSIFTFWVNCMLPSRWDFSTLLKGSLVQSLEYWFGYVGQILVSDDKWKFCLHVSRWCYFQVLFYCNCGDWWWVVVSLLCKHWLKTYLSWSCTQCILAVTIYLRDETYAPEENC